MGREWKENETMYEDSDESKEKYEKQ